MNENEIERAERIIGRVMKAMIICPGTKEDMDAKEEYIKYKMECAQERKVYESKKRKHLQEV